MPKRISWEREENEVMERLQRRDLGGTVAKKKNRNYAAEAK